MLRRILIIIFIVAVMLFIVLGCKVSDQDITEKAPEANTVILSTPDDSYYELAKRISQTENIPLVNSVESALNQNPTFLLWIASPGHFSDQVFSDFGLAIKKSKKVISTGIITGSTIEKAEKLWQRKTLTVGKFISIVSREDRFVITKNDKQTFTPISKESFISEVQDSDYLVFQGHGSRGYWQIQTEGDVKLIQSDIPPLPPLFVDSGGCQTFRLWHEDSIAVAFTDQGATAYTGFVYSPNGYLFGGPTGFPYQYTWPAFPVGHITQIQNRSLLQGFLNWPFYFLLGDPRLSFRSEAPYDLVDDTENGNVRTLRFTNAPKGIIPVHIKDGAKYKFVEIFKVAKSWERDSFYNNKLQMINIGSDKYLLFDHPGGDFTVKLYDNSPLYLPVTVPIVRSLDHTMIVYHQMQGSDLSNIVLLVIIILVVGALFWRRKVNIRKNIWKALIVGLVLPLFRGIYVLLRQEHLTEMYNDYLRTMNMSFEINFIFLLITFILATCGMLLFFNIKSRLGKVLTFLTVTFPGWAMAIFWLGSVSLFNFLSFRKFGLALYGFGGALMPFITFLIEGILILIAIIVTQKFKLSKDVGGVKSEKKISQRNIMM